jgi:hypothetical protein
MTHEPINFYAVFTPHSGADKSIMYFHGDSRELAWDHAKIVAQNIGGLNALNVGYIPRHLRRELPEAGVMHPFR